MGIKNSDFADSPAPRQQVPSVTDQAGNEVDLVAEYEAAEAAEADALEAEPNPGWMPDAEWKALGATPEGKKARSLLAQRQSAVTHRDSTLQSLQTTVASLQQQLAAQTVNNQRSAERPFADVPEGELKSWLANSRALQNRALREPDNAELQEEAKKILERDLVNVEEEMLERKLEARLNGKLAPLKAAAEESQLNGALRAGWVAAGVNVDALTNEHNPMRIAAANRAQSAAERLGVSDQDTKTKAAIAYMAMLHEKELAEARDRAGRTGGGGNAFLRRQLGIEAGARRAASSAAETSPVAPNGNGKSDAQSRLRRTAVWMQRSGMLG